MYNRYLSTLTSRFHQSFASIQAYYNFDYGDEFEIALCEVFSELLPERYGVCRGFAVTHDDESAGDDILIFDQTAFPRLGARRKNDFARKESIPIESVYAYIEAKYTLNVGGDDGQSLQKSMTQASRVKELCFRRTKVDLAQITPYLRMKGGFASPKPGGYPDYQNPPYSAIFSMRVRDKKGGEILDSHKNIVDLFENHPANKTPNEFYPDVIVAGAKSILIPAGNNQTVSNPFNLPQSDTKLAFFETTDDAFALGFLHLLWALDFIQLSPLPFHEIIPACFKPS